MNNKLHVYTGNGKGKTTAAMGLAVRSAGHGRRVLIAQFLKDGRSGELNAFKMLPSVEVYPMKPVRGFVFAMSEEEKRQTEKEQRAQALALRTYIEQSRPELIVLDELNVALSTGMMDRETADALLETEREKVPYLFAEGIMSRRYAQALADAAETDEADR